MDDDRLNLDPEGKEESSPYTNLSGSFGAVDLSADAGLYNINQAASLIEKMKDILRKSSTASRLLDLAESRSDTLGESVQVLLTIMPFKIEFICWHTHFERIS